MNDKATTVVVTGASAGFGRAIATAYGARGATVGLIACEQAGLVAAAADVEHAVGRTVMLRWKLPIRKQGSPPSIGWRARLVPSTCGSMSHRSPTRARARVGAKVHRRGRRKAEVISTEQLDEMARAYPLGRIWQPADVAQAVLYLAASASSWVTGLTLDLTGGRVIG